MGRVSLEALTPGLRLNKPVFNLHGLLLLKGGEILSAKHLEMLKTWGIREADVVQENGEELQIAPEAQIPREIWAAAEAEAARRFRRVDTMGDPVLREVRRIVTNRLARRAMLGASLPAPATAE
jgi:hypothetical protein